MLERLQQQVRFKIVRLVVQSTDKDPNFPMIEVGPYKLTGHISEQQALIALRAAQDRKEQISK